VLLVAITLCTGLSFAASASGQTLAEVARAAEAARKNAADRPPAPVYTNDDLKPVPPGTAPPSEATSAAPAPASAPDRPDAPSASPADSLGSEPKGEAYWRDRMRPLRERLDRTRALADDTKRRADALRRSADRCFQLGVVCKDYTDSLQLSEEHKALVAEVARAERDVTALQEEARRAGVPPGWLRGR
jgi:hypothetical protein